MGKSISASEASNKRVPLLWRRVGVRLLFCILISYNTNAQTTTPSSLPTKTSFQEAAPWNAAYDIRTDIAMVYGMDSTFDERIKGYRNHGYNVQFMTGIAWGNYQDYFTGKWDGKEHEETEGQVDRNGNHIGHG
ncbi:MAG: hypothetical protein ABI359_12515, partial [Ginsengibacter sp.]